MKWTNLQLTLGYTKAAGDNKTQKMQIIEVAPGKQTQFLWDLFFLHFLAQLSIFKSCCFLFFHCISEHNSNNHATFSRNTTGGVICMIYAQLLAQNGLDWPLLFSSADPLELPIQFIEAHI